MSRLEEFYGAHPEHRPAAPLEEMARGSDMYRRRMGLGPATIPRELYSTVEVDPARGGRIGAAYDALPEFDPAAVPSYEAMRRETGRQFEFLTGSRGRGGLGVDVGVTQEDPYDTPAAMREDLAGGRLNVLSSAATGGHPFFNNDENDMFRAVHDAFGHAATGRGFDRHGEEAAWLEHSSMFSPLARGAMSSETRGQNSAFIFNSGGRIFPVQKVALLPPSLRNPATAVTGRRSGQRPTLGKQFKLA